MQKISTVWTVLAILGSALMTSSPAADAPVGYTDTPVIPGQKWHVHDPNRPHPRVVTSGETFSHNAPAPKRITSAISIRSV